LIEYWQSMEAKIKKALLSNPDIGIDANNITITSLLGGKESSIYKVTDKKGKSVVVKIPKTDWQKREIRVFKEYLSKFTINTPEFLGDDNDEILIIEFLDDYHNSKKLSLNELELLKNWIVAKHKKSKALFKDIPTSLSKHIDWMIKNPISHITSCDELSGDVKEKLTKLGPRLVDMLETIDLPLVLDHCDLEVQNLLFNSENNKICVIDWANAIKSPGFFDIAQFKKLAKQYVLDKADDLISGLMKEVEYSEYSDLLEIFSLIREINLLSYYLKRRGKNYKKDIEYSCNIITKYEQQN